jgi:predicted dinucleotide-binding enzyme
LWHPTGHPAGDPRGRALTLAGDDIDARKLAAKLDDQFGFGALDIGDVFESWQLDPACIRHAANLEEL